MTTILCVEDEAPLRGAIVEELLDNNYDVLQATDGREGLEMMLKHEPDLVLCDIIMPHMNGYDLVKTLREKHPRLADTPFIFLSALADRRENGGRLATIKHLRRATPEDWLLSQWNPAEGERVEFSLPRTDWTLAHRVIGKHSRP